MATEGQQKGKQAKKAATSMKEPISPMQAIPRSRDSRSYETGSPQWSSSASPPLPRPKPAELIDRYVAQGMEKEAASEKVIEDLQAALQRSLYPMQRLASLDKTFRSSAVQFESASARLALIESKLDTKPNIAQVFAAGVAAGAFLQTAVKVAPPVIVALNDILSNIKQMFQR